jgi:hypothetical protein
MYNTRPITTIKLFDAEALIASGTATSAAIDLREIAQSYKFSAEYTTTGTGTTKIEYLLCSTEDGTYIDAGTDIGATLAAGHDILPFASGEPELAPFMKIKITEDGTTNAVAVTLYLNIQ